MAAPAKLKISKRSKEFGQFANLPSTFKGSAPKELLDKQKLLAKLDNLKNFDNRQLAEAVTLLTQLNRYNMKHDKRVELATTVLSHVYAVMARHYQQYQAKVLSLPESQQRREILLSCIHITEQVAIAYKHYFKSIYTSSGLGYRRHRKVLTELGGHILEFLRLEQRFRALRHQKFPASSWLDANRVFFSLLLHNDIDEPVQLLGTIGTWVKQIKGSQQNPAPLATPRKLYLSIQLFGLLDAASWSPRLFHGPDSYLCQFEDGMQLHVDINEDLVPGWLVTHIDNNAAALFHNDAHMAKPRIRIEYTNLYNRLISDDEELAKMKFLGAVQEDKLSRPLLDLENIERFPFLEAMIFGLRPRERKQKRHAAFGHEKLKLYFSFKDTYSMFVEMADDIVKRISRANGFSESLAASSSAVVDNPHDYKNTHWEIVNFSTGGILVLTRETVFTNPIQIGQIVAFNPNEDVKRPLLGYVSRINRPSDQQVEVAIVRFANHAEAAVVQNELDKDAAVGEGGILFKSMEGSWCLVAQHAHDFVPGTPIKLLRENNQRVPARLGNVMLTKQEFVVFGLSAPGM